MSTTRRIKQRGQRPMQHRDKKWVPRGRETTRERQVRREKRLIRRERLARESALVEQFGDVDTAD